MLDIFDIVIININVKIFINYSYAQINNIFLISLKIFRNLREFDN